MLKRTTLTVSYYVIAATILLLLNDAYPSGPCTPGLGVFGFIILIPISIALLIRNIYVTQKVGKDNLLATIIHTVACILLLVPFV